MKPFEEMRTFAEIEEFVDKIYPGDQHMSRELIIDNLYFRLIVMPYLAMRATVEMKAWEEYDS